MTSQLVRAEPTGEAERPDRPLCLGAESALEVVSAAQVQAQQEDQLQGRIPAEVQVEGEEEVEAAAVAGSRVRTHSNSSRAATRLPSPLLSAGLPSSL